MRSQNKILMTIKKNIINNRPTTNYGNIFLIIGPSGVGKNTLINEIISKDENIKFIPSVTTREMREGERKGMPYRFVSQKEFKELRNNKELLEWQKWCDRKKDSRERESFFTIG